MVEIQDKKRVKDVPMELSILDERIFVVEDDLYDDDGIHKLRFDVDSLVITWEGHRGSGKTTMATWFVGYLVAHYNMKVIANYAIEFQMRRHRPDGKTYLQHVKAEPLDFEKLILFDEEYKHVLIVIDEAADVVSHLSSQGYRNRLAAAFIRQIRKNRSTLFLCSQSYDWIDKSIRGQVDVLVRCKDASRQLGDDSQLERGAEIWTSWYDQSGEWTGQSTQERTAQKKDACVMTLDFFPRVLWGDKTHKAAFDSWYQIDILDSLRKVDLKMSALKIGDRANEADRYPVSVKTLRTTLSSILYVIEQHPDAPNIYRDYFKQALGGITDSDWNNLGRVLSKFNVESGRDSNNGKRWYGFSSFDLEGFKQYIESQETGT
jgi:hypothetical protein